MRHDRTVSPSRKANLLLLMLLLSAFSGLMFAVPIASAATSSGTIQSSETWSGSHSVTGDIHIPAGVKVTVQPNTQVTLNNGTKIVVARTMVHIKNQYIVIAARL